MATRASERTLIPAICAAALQAEKMARLVRIEYCIFRERILEFDSKEKSEDAQRKAES